MTFSKEKIIENVKTKCLQNILKSTKTVLEAKALVSAISPISDELRQQAIDKVEPTYYGYTESGLPVPGIVELTSTRITKWSQVSFANADEKQEIFSYYDKLMKQAGFGDKPGVCYRLQCESLLLGAESVLIYELEDITGLQSRRLVLSEQRKKYLDICITAIVALNSDYFDALKTKTLTAS